GRDMLCHQAHLKWSTDHYRPDCALGSSLKPRIPWAILNNFILLLIAIDIRKVSALFPSAISDWCAKMMRRWIRPVGEVGMIICPGKTIGRAYRKSPSI